MDCSVQELKVKYDVGEEFLLLDVRTHEELEIAKIEGCVHIPLHELEERVRELKAWKDKEVVCLCHHGTRSAMAQRFLESEGYPGARNLAGGIHAWASEVDPSIAQYG